MIEVRHVVVCRPTLVEKHDLGNGNEKSVALYAPFDERLLGKGGARAVLVKVSLVR